MRQADPAFSGIYQWAYCYCLPTGSNKDVKWFPVEVTDIKIKKGGVERERNQNRQGGGKFVPEKKGGSGRNFCKLGHKYSRVFVRGERDPPPTLPTYRYGTGSPAGDKRQFLFIGLCTSASRLRREGQQCYYLYPITIRRMPSSISIL